MRQLLRKPSMPGRPSRFRSPPPSRPRRATTSRSPRRLPRRRPPSPPRPCRAKCANADALGVSRVVVVDTTGGPGFGFQQYKQLDFLTDKEVVLTFDDGPWPTTPSVLKSLAEECTKATFFPVGKHSTYHPEILKQVYAAGHTVGSHTWSHAHLDSKKLTEAQVKEEIEKGFSAIKLAIGASARAVLPLSGTAAYPGFGGISRLAQHRDVLHRRRLLRLQVQGRRADRQHRDDQARQAGQGHHPDARSAEAHREPPCRRCCAASRPAATRSCT